MERYYIVMLLVLAIDYYKSNYVLVLTIDYYKGNYTTLSVNYRLWK